MGKAVAAVLCISAWTSLASELPDTFYLESLSPGLAQAVVDAYGSARSEAAAAEDAAARADAWGRLGMFLHAQHLSGPAEWAYGLALAEKSDARWHHLRGVVFEEQGEIEAALTDYRSALQLSRDDATALRLARGSLVAGDPAAAESALRGTDNDGGDSAIMLATRADIALARERWEDAAGLLERAHALEPEAGALAYKLAMVYRRLGNASAAREWLARRGDSNAVPQIDDSLLLEVAKLSLSARFFVKMGEWALARGDVDAASDSLARAVALAPGDTDIGLTYVHVLGIAGQRDAAVEEVGRLLDADAETARGWYLLAWLLRTSADQSEQVRAREAARRSLRLAEDERTRALAAALSMRDHRFEEAVADYQLLAAGAAERDQAYYLYWLSLAMLGHGDCRARGVLAKALGLRRQWGEAHLVMARAEALCGEAAIGRRRVEALLAVRDDPDTRLTKAFVELASGNVRKAEVLAKDDLPHPDATMVLEALDGNGLPARPFAAGSVWWLPVEIQPESP